jgi:hypothetical protein
VPAAARRRPPALAAALAALCALAATGCITRTSRETVVDDGRTKVMLRSEKRGLSLVEQGYDHPKTIAPVRMAHILSRIDLQPEAGKKNERRPAIPTETLYEVADALAKGLAAADPNQEVVLLSVRRSKRLGIFDRHHLTSLRAWAKDDVLYLQVARSDWEVPKRMGDRLPEPHAGEQAQAFRLLVDDGMSLVDPQSVSIDWRSPVFAKPSRTRITPSGRVMRTTILMESEEEAPPQRPDASPELSPEQLRALADLEEARRAGTLSEAEYTAQRNRILDGPPDAR